MWWGMLAVAVVVLGGVVFAWLHALRRAPQSRDEAAARRIGRRWIVLGGVGLPAASTVALLAFGIPAGERMQLWPAMGETALRIEVTGHRWWWEVRYPEAGIVLSDELHLPVGRLVELHLRSADVIHSFWVPRLGGKMDLVPGRTGVLRLRADRVGMFRGQCAEYCGTEHAFMVLRVEAHEAPAFADWLAERSQ